MKKYLVTIFIALGGLSLFPVVADNIASDAYLFLYSPAPQAGMHVAVSVDGHHFEDVGQLFTSDYSQWGAEKRMFAPIIYGLAGGGFAAVFQVNDHAPCIAVSWSADLLTWRPQDYPHMSVRGCLAPVIKMLDADNYKILFKTKNGEIRKVLVDKNFRTFSSDVAATQSEYDEANFKRDTATVGDKQYIGQLWRVPLGETKHIRQYFDQQRESNRRNGETLAGEAHFGTLSWNARLTIHPEQAKTISDRLIGVFFEDISYAADGGLYAELIQNRDFEYTAKDHKGWNSLTAWRMSKGVKLASDRSLSANNVHHLLMKADTLYNIGWDGIVVEKGKRYDFSFFARVDKGTKTFRVALMNEGKEIASARLKAKGPWHRYEAVLDATADADKAELRLIGEGKTEAAVDLISLFPQDTYKGRKNGLRRDLAEAIAELKPKFVRFPGGCMSHGQGIDNIYHWQHTVGPLQDRKPDFNIWHYHQTRGLGFYEYFQFCEDIGAEPLPVLAAGVPCQNSAPNSEGYGGQQGGIPMDEMPAYIEELCNLIEWANGDPATNAWAKMRADAGHPAPFNLKMIGIGNEDIISTTFKERYLMICKGIKERYPEITICGTVGPFHSPSSDYIEGWKIADENRDIIDMVDEHYYESVGWFLNNQHYYDNYDRNGAKVYLGEYAAHVGNGGVDCALAEAVHLCNIERNADVVAMTSYAPLLSKNGHSNWRPDMIYFDNKKIEKMPSYETQRLFSVYGGDRYIESTLQVDSTIANRVVASVVHNSKTAKTYLKVVNVLPTDLNLSVEGMQLSNVMKYEGFEGKPGQRHGKITRGEYRGNRITIPPYSLRVIEL